MANTSPIKNQVRIYDSHGNEIYFNNSWTQIDIAYPSDTTETYTYKKNSDTLATITLTYADSTKEQIIKVERA